MHCDWFILLLLLPTPTIWFSLVSDRKQSWKKWKHSDSYDFTYDSNFRFSIGHKCCYDSAYDSKYESDASENQPLQLRTLLHLGITVRLDINIWVHLLHLCILQLPNKYYSTGFLIISTNWVSYCSWSWGLFCESPNTFSTPKSCSVFFVFAFKIKVPIILKMIK